MDKKHRQSFSCHHFLDDVRLPSGSIVKDLALVKKLTLEKKVRTIIGSFADEVTNLRKKVDSQSRVNKETQVKYSKCRSDLNDIRKLHNDKLNVINSLKETVSTLRVDISARATENTNVKQHLQLIQDSARVNRVLRWSSLGLNVIFISYFLWEYVLRVI